MFWEKLAEQAFQQIFSGGDFMSLILSLKKNYLFIRLRQTLVVAQGSLQLMDSLAVACGF